MSRQLIKDEQLMQVPTKLDDILRDLKNPAGGISHNQAKQQIKDLMSELLKDPECDWRCDIMRKTGGTRTGHTLSCELIRGKLSELRAGLEAL